MRLHFVALLAATVLLANANASPTADSKLLVTRSSNGDQKNDISAARRLRMEADGTKTEEDDEERVFKVPSSIKNFFKPGTSSKVTTKVNSNVASNVAKEIPDPKAWLAAGKSVDDAFVAFKLDKADDLLGSPNFMSWFGYVTQFNQKNGDKATTVIKSLTGRYGDKGVAEILIKAASSKNSKTQELARGLMVGQMDDWMKAKQNPKAIAKLFGLDKLTSAQRAADPTMKVVKAYDQHYKQAIAKAAEKAKKAAAATS